MSNITPWQKQGQPVLVPHDRLALGDPDDAPVGRVHAVLAREVALLVYVRADSASTRSRSSAWRLFSHGSEPPPYHCSGG